MRTQAEPADQRALELVVRHGLCAEGGAVEIADALSGIGDDLANDLALNGIGAMPLQRRLDCDRQSARGIESVVAGRGRKFWPWIVDMAGAPKSMSPFSKVGSTGASPRNGTGWNFNFSASAKFSTARCGMVPVPAWP